VRKWRGCRLKAAVETAPTNAAVERAPSGFSVFFFSDTSFASVSTMFMYSSKPCGEHSG
jgi:hypothetical protein